MAADIETTPALVEAAAARYGDAPFLVDDARTISFREFRQQCRRVAAALLARDIDPGERIAIWAPNVHEWVIAAFGIHCAGGVLVTLNTRHKAAEAAQTLNDSGARLLFSVGTFLDTDYPASLAAAATPALEEVVTIGETAATATAWDAFLDSGRAVGDDALDTRQRSLSGEMTSDILFTSGTTGRPKGVVTAHAQNLRAFAAFADILGLVQDDRYLVINPFFHSFGYKAGVLAALLSGASVYPLPLFDVHKVLDTVQRHRITVMPGPPTLFQSILDDPRRTDFDISSLRKATTGAAVIPVELVRRAREELGIDTLLTAYGLSESCGIATICRPGDDAETVARTSGRALPGVEVRCADADGRALPAGEAGEIQVRGYNVMQGYFNDPEATAAAIDEDGWLHTGDIGTLDERGNLRITDRLKDMFTCGGFNCYPAEIEQMLTRHPAVAAAAVVGSPDGRLGEVAHAWVVRRAGETVDEEALIAWCREQMANYKVPRRIHFTAALPMNASGKVLKHELRAHCAEH
jgi:acyl-CoA synthetase (AMP-forming)/AMP-acid ligase II